MGNPTEAPLPGSAPGPKQGFRDGLGERLITAGAGQNELLDVLHLRRELAAAPSFEFALRERAARLANFQHAAYARVRQIDRLAPPDGRLAVVSEHVTGWRLAEILSGVKERHLELDINAALCLIKQLVHGVAILHQHARGVAHGALGPERVVVTAHARLVIVEYVLGSALERLEMTREQLWRELRIAVPPAAGGPHLDPRADVTQLGTIAMALVLGCLLASDDYPDHMAELLAMATENRTLGGRRPVSKPLRTWLARALQLDLHRSFPSAIEAESELEALLIAEPSYVAAPVALETFLALYQRSMPPAPKISERPAEAPARPVAPPPAPSGRPVDAALELGGVIAELDHLLGEAVPAEQPGPVVEPGARTPAAQTRPIVEPADHVPAQQARPVVEPVDRVAAKQPRPVAEPAGRAAAKVGIDRGYPGAFGSLLGSQAPAAIADQEESERDDLRAHAVAGRQPRKGRMLRITRALAALLVLAAGGYFVFQYVLPATVQPTTGTLLVETQPAGLSVKIDGSARGTTPVKMTLPPGQHQLELETGGQPRVIPITITAGGQVSQYIEVQAAPATGRLQVTSEPAGATVLVDGERRGTAPLLVTDLAVGRHRVELQADGATVQQQVTIEPGGTNSLVVPMSARSGPLSGWLTVSSPVELQVFEGNQLVGTSGSDRILMTAGRHEVDLVNEALDYRARQTVEVVPGKVVPLKVQLPKGAVSVNALPWAEVWVDGERVGETPIGNLALPIGPHEIVFRHPQLGEQRHAVTVTTKAPARVSVDLRK